MANHARSKVAVIGAAGTTGQALIAALIRRGATVRALVHRNQQRELFPHVADVRVIELDTVQSIKDAVSGAATVHYIPPVFNTNEEQFGANVIAASTHSGIERLVYHSVLHAPTPAMPHHLRKSRVELMLRESRLKWTIVQPAMYAQTPLAFLDADRTCLTPGFSVDQWFTPVDNEDLANAVAIILTGDGHDYATYELAGCERLSFREMAATVSDILGKDVAARAVDPELLVAQARTRGFSEAAGREIGLMMAHYDQHGLVGNPNILKMLLGRTPNTFAVAARRSLAAQH